MCRVLWSVVVVAWCSLFEIRRWLLFVGCYMLFVVCCSLSLLLCVVWSCLRLLCGNDCRFVLSYVVVVGCCVLFVASVFVVVLFVVVLFIVSVIARRRCLLFGGCCVLL